MSEQSMIRFQVMRGSGLRPDAHGLIGNKVHASSKVFRQLAGLFTLFS